MLTPVAEGVLVHESAFCQSNAVVVQGRDGVLLVDPGVQDHELACLANDLAEAGLTVVAGFSTHPHWDHLLWHARLGTAPRYGTAACAASARDQLSDPDAKAGIAAHLEPTEIAGQVSLELFGLLTALPAETAHVPWEGPRARIIEHRAHAPGHAALLIEGRGVLVAGDMLSDVLIPMLDVSAADPIDDYLAALQLLADAAGDADVVIPGHGSVGGAGEAHTRINRDREYVHALRDSMARDSKARDSKAHSDPRIGPAARPGWEWVADVHDGQAQRLAAGNERGGS